MKRFVFSLLLTPALMAAEPKLDASKYGKVLSEKAAVKVSSTSEYDTPETHLNLVRGPKVPCAFHTGKEKNPSVILKLPAVAEVKALEVLNRGDGSGYREATLSVSLSEDGKTWTEVWSAGGREEDRWVIPCVDASGQGKKAGWVKLETKPAKAEFFHLSRVTVYGN